MFVSHGQREMLDRFKLSEYQSFNPLLNIFNGDVPVKVRVQGIFDYFNGFIDNHDGVSMGGIYYSFMGCSITVYYRGKEFVIDLRMVDPMRVPGNKGILDYYLSFLHENVTVRSWDEAYSFITGNTTDLPFVPFISADTLLTVLTPFENSVNNHRPSFMRTKKLGDNSGFKSNIITVSGVKEIEVRNIVSKDLGIITSLRLVKNDSERQDFFSSHELLDHLFNMVYT